MSRSRVKSSIVVTVTLFVLGNLGTNSILGMATSPTSWVSTRLDTQKAEPVIANAQGIHTTAAGVYYTCAITADGGVKCWGSNNSGQLGDGTTIQRLTPVEVQGLADVAAIVAGAAHTCALTTGGGVKCWGANSQGQLGDGTTTQRLAPVDVSGLTTGVTAIAAGYHHTCAVTDLGAVKCWGNNSNGQLGDGTTTQRLTPVDVNGLSNDIAHISTGNIHTCALTTGGAVKCWGWNAMGQLGDGTTTRRLTPVDVTGLSGGIAEILTGDVHSCALTTGGGVKCWGNNSSGQVGDGTTTQRTIPVDVSGLASGVADLAATSSSFHTCTLTDAGGVKCWGDSDRGQLGDGTTTQRLTPVDVSGLASGVTALASGREHTCAVVNPSTRVIKCWGGNDYGQLGDGSTQQRTMPVNVVGWNTAGTIPVSGELLHALGSDLAFANTFTATAIVTHTVLPPSTAGSIASLYSINYYYEVTAVYSDTGRPAQPVPGQTYTTTIQYADADKGAAIEDTLGLYYWDGSQWQAETTSTVYTETNTIVATPNHLSIWAVLGETRRVFLPTILKQ